MRESTALLAGAAMYCFTHHHVTKYNNEKFGPAAGTVTGIVTTVSTYTALSILTWLSGLVYATLKSLHDFSKNPSLTTETLILASAGTAFLVWKQLSRSPNSPINLQKTGYF